MKLCYRPLERGLFLSIVPSTSREALSSIPAMTSSLLSSIISCLAWTLALLLLPALLADRLTLSEGEHIRRLHGNGWSQRRIADRLGISRHRIKKALA